jgi:cytoskeleton protein RodZ
VSTNLIAESVSEQGPVEVRADARIAGAVGAIAAAVAIAYLTRAVGGGGWLDWALVLVTGAIAAAHLQSLLDARVPLLVVDGHGVRFRKGRTWRGLPWQEIEYVEHEPRHGLLRDGRVVLVPCDGDEGEQAVTLSLSTRVVGADGDLTRALELLAGNPDQVVEVVPEELDERDEAFEEDLEEVEDVAETEDVVEDAADVEEVHHAVLHDPRPAIARGIGFLADRLRRPAPDEDDLLPEPTVTLPPLVASATPLPLRDAVTGVRAEVRFEGAAALKTDRVGDQDQTRAGLPETDELRRTAAALEDTAVWSDRVRPLAEPGSPVEPLVVDDLAPAPAADPVVGPELAAARTRLSLTVDQLAERTRIRPHVIESIEVDDFAPCGGDFYARGHLRTLARVLGIDAAPLLASYDERYAEAPIDARRVFEAELATGEGGPIRSTRGGPNWSVLVAAVMAVVLAWSIARLIMDSPVELHSKPVLNGSPSSPARLGPAVPVVLDASAGGAHVVVRDGAGEVVFNGDLAFGQSRTFKAAPPVRVQSSDGGLNVTLDGQDRGPLGADGQPAQNTFAAAE